MKHLIRLLISLVLVGAAQGALAGGIDLQKSTFQWKGTKKLGSFHTGKISLQKAELQMKDKAVTGGEFIIDMNSITNEDIEGEYKAKFLGHIKSGDFFEVEKYPTAKLVIENVSGDQASGKLTIKGQTQPVTVPFKKDGDTYLGTLKFDRTQFGIKYNSANFFKNLVADKVIDDEVTVAFKVVTTQSEQKK